MRAYLAKFLAVALLISMLGINGLAHSLHRVIGYRYGYVTVSRRYEYRNVYYRRSYYRRRHNHSTRNAILQGAVPAAAGLGVGALIGGRKGAGIGALVGGGGGLAYHLLTRRR